MLPVVGVYVRINWGFLLKVSIVSPVLNEAMFIGYSIMALHPYVEEFVYAVSPKSDDGTIEILRHIAKNYGNVRILLQSKYDFNPLDEKAYNGAFDDCIQQARGDAVAFIHPDMVAYNGEVLQSAPDALAWYTNITSFARDFKTTITKGRCDKWKNIHAKKFGLVYRGAYGSQNEDMYFTDITGGSYKHFGAEFSKYPFVVKDSGIKLAHFCENKPYERRLEKMKLCIRTQNPKAHDSAIEELATNHPRVTLESSSQMFGNFEFEETNTPLPSVFETYKDEFAPFQKEKVMA